MGRTVCSVNTTQDLHLNPQHLCKKLSMPTAVPVTPVALINRDSEMLRADGSTHLDSLVMCSKAVKWR